jgi:hypothetical protein
MIGDSHSFRFSALTAAPKIQNLELNEREPAMHTITIKSHIGADGLLHLNIPTNMQDYDVEILIVLQPLKPIVTPKNNWPDGFFQKTYGCLKDDPIERGNQGDFPIREEVL